MGLDEGEAERGELLGKPRPPGCWEQMTWALGLCYHWGGGKWGGSGARVMHFLFREILLLSQTDASSDLLLGPHAHLNGLIPSIVTCISAHFIDETERGLKGVPQGHGQLDTFSFISFCAVVI